MICARRWRCATCSHGEVFVEQPDGPPSPTLEPRQHGDGVEDDEDRGRDPWTHRRQTGEYLYGDPPTTDDKDPAVDCGDDARPDGVARTAEGARVDDAEGVGGLEDGDQNHQVATNLDDRGALLRGHVRAGDEDRDELLAEELRLAQRALGEITGQVTTEDLLGQIFSKFCIGK